MRQHSCRFFLGGERKRKRERERQEKESEQIPVHSVEDNRSENMTVMSFSLSDISHWNNTSCASAIFPFLWCSTPRTGQKVRFPLTWFLHNADVTQNCLDLRWYVS